MITRSTILILAALTQLGAAPDAATHYARLTAALTDDSQWVRVHAAEALISLGKPKLARAAFEPIADTTEPRYRVVVWRVLAAAATTPETRQKYIDRIRQTSLDPSEAELPHAMEALAKLAEPLANDTDRERTLTIADAAGPASPFAAWRLAQANDPTAARRLFKLLRHDDPTIRARAAYVLSRLHPQLPGTADAISTALRSEPPDSPAKLMLRLSSGPDAVRDLARDSSVPASGRYLAAMWLADFGTASDRETLTTLTHDPDHDVQVGAAFALLRLDLPTSKTTTR